MPSNAPIRYRHMTTSVHVVSGMSSIPPSSMCSAHIQWPNVLASFVMTSFTKRQAGFTLTGSTNGFRQVTKEVPSAPRVAAIWVRAIKPGRTPTPEKWYSHMPTSSLYRLTTPSSMVSTHTRTHSHITSGSTVCCHLLDSCPWLCRNSTGGSLC